MGEVLRNLFGGSKSTQTQRSLPGDFTPEEFKGLRPTLAAEIHKSIGGGNNYQGPYVAPITGTEQSVLADLMGMAGSGTPRQGYLDQVIAGGFQGLNPAATGAMSNPFLDAAIRAAQRPTLEGLTETLTRDLPGRFTSAGQFVQPQGSSAFDRAAAIATRGVSDTLGDIATNMSYQNYEAERGRQFQGFENERGRQQEAVQLSRAEVDTAISNLQAQGLPRLIEDMGIERALATFKDQVNNLLGVLQLLGGVSGPTIANTTVGSAESTTQRGIIPGLFGTGGTPMPKPPVG